MNIDLQEIADARKQGHFAIHRKVAQEVIAKGGSIYVSDRGQPIGKATTSSELDRLLGNEDVQDHKPNDSDAS